MSDVRLWLQGGLVMTGRLLRLLVLGCGLAWAALAGAEVITVASPFPKELLMAYKRAVEARYPGLRVQYVHFPATNAVSFLQDRAPGTRPDVFWGSAPDTFLSLRRNGLLEPLGDLGEKSIPERIGRLQVNDPDGYYKGQALSGYGIMWNTRYLAARGITPPRNWRDLARPEYFGHVVMSTPSRSGTNHLMVEAILQGEGWQAGWAQILRIAGNCGMIADRSSGVPNSVTSGRYGAGMVVDFLGLSARYSGLPVDFTYARPSAVSVANIALVRGARNPEGGKRFIEFTLSAAGQEVLLRPDIGRLPVLPAVYESPQLPRNYPRVKEVVERSATDYDPDLSEGRYRIVGAIFDQLVTFRHDDLVAVSRLLHSAEKLLARRADPKAADLIQEARTLAFRVPLDEQAVQAASKGDARAEIARIAALEAELGRQAEANYAKARHLAEQALARLR